jgi:hypothetical protein
MGFWQTVTGRSKPKQANLDSVCFRAATGAGFAQTQADVVELLRGVPDAPEVSTSSDEFGFTWLQVRRPPEDSEGLCTDLHAVNTTLEGQGFGPGLLCSLVPFADAAGRRVGLVYLYKQGTFYPFAPTGPQQRDNLLELSVRDALEGELPIEPELSSWMALWGAPGL